MDYFYIDIFGPVFGAVDELLKFINFQVLKFYLTNLHLDSVRMRENADQKTPNKNTFHAVLDFISHYIAKLSSSIWVSALLKFHFE